MHFQHPNLTLGQIYSALAYYADHQEELDKDIERRLQGRDPDFRIMHKPLEPMNLPDFSIASISLPSSSSEEGV